MASPARRFRTPRAREPPVSLMSRSRERSRRCILMSSRNPRRASRPRMQSPSYRHRRVLAGVLVAVLAAVRSEGSAPMRVPLHVLVDERARAGGLAEGPRGIVGDESAYVLQEVPTALVYPTPGTPQPITVAADGTLSLAITCPPSSKVASPSWLPSFPRVRSSSSRSAARPNSAAPAPPG